MIINPLAIGTEIKFPMGQVFFGNKYATLENVKNYFVHCKFKRIKQTHGDVVVATDLNSDDSKIEADAHYTKEKNLGLCISTADCIPIMGFDVQSGICFAIHAGWRGVQNKIFEKTILKILQNSNSSPESMQIFIGPHIQKNSFEIEKHLALDLLQTANLQSELDPSLKDTDKVFVDLNFIVKEQARLCGINMENIYCEYIDTKTNVNYHSYRRDKENSGRQISFCCLQS